MSLPSSLKNQFLIGDIIGKGRFSNVHVCTNKTTGEIRAVKIIQKVGGVLVDEVAILKPLAHRNVIKYITHAETADNLFIITDYIKGDDLSVALARMTFSLRGVAFIMANLMKALSYLHGLQIVHRTIKPDSIFLQFSGNKPTVVKIGDFGKAAKLDHGIQFGDWGLPEYRAPEMAYAYNCKIDMYAAGKVFMEFYSPHREEFAKIQSHYILMSLSVNPDFQDLMEGMLQPDPMKRFSADYVLNHCWIRKFSTN